MRIQTTTTIALLLPLLCLGCAEGVRLSRGTRMPPELRGMSSAQVTEHFTRHAGGEHLSMVATLIDFSYLRAITRERGRSIDVEREAYRRYVRRQTSFYVHLIVHGLENCREGEADIPSSRGRLRRRAPQLPLDFEQWSFTLRSSSGREMTTEELEPGPTQLAPSGGCLVQGYVHFPVNISRRDEWVELEASPGNEGRERVEVRWVLEPWAPPRGRRPPPRRPRPEESSAEDGRGEPPAAPSREETTGQESRQNGDGVSDEF